MRLATLGTQDTGRRKKKKAINTTQKIKIWGEPRRMGRLR